MNQLATTRAALLPSLIGRRAGDEGVQHTRDLEKTMASNMAEILEA